MPKFLNTIWNWRLLLREIIGLH